MKRQNKSTGAMARGVMAALLVGAMALPAAAQLGGGGASNRSNREVFVESDPPTVNPKPETKSQWASMMWLGLFGVMVFAVTLIPPKRGHKD